MVSEADKIRELQGISSERNSSAVLGPRETEQNRQDNRQYQLVKKGLDQKCPTLDEKQKQQLTQELIEDPKKNIKVGDEVLCGADLAFIVAESIQRINSETNPEEEYWRWIDNGQKIVHDMTDGEITYDDVTHRDEFLNDLDQREIEIRSCVALYRSSNSPRAKEKLDFLMVKWAKLLEIRSAIKNGTKDKEDARKNPEPKEEERLKAGKYLVLLAAVKNDREASDIRTWYLEGQDIIKDMNGENITAEAIRRRQRYLESLEKRRQALMAMIALYQHPTSQADYERLQKMQRELAEFGEIQNVIRMATKSREEALRNPLVSEQEREKAKVYYAVLQYRLDGKHIPDRVLYKLQVKTPVQEYSLAEEIVDHRGKTRSKEESIALINKLRGRQSYVLKPKSEIRSFSPELYKQYLQQRENLRA